MDHVFGWEGAPGPATLRLPAGEVRAGLVTLHGARDGRARQPLFDQIAQHLTPLGVAVLSYERRAVVDGETPLQAQAEDAVAATRALRARLRRPVGIFGFSQGAWAATLAAADEAAGFLIVLGCSAVTPAEQMRFHTDELLRRHGFGEHDRAWNRTLRRQWEDYLRSSPPDRGRRDELAGALRAASRERWFRFAYLPDAPRPGGAGWPDMDFDPSPGFAKVRAPVLALWGADEECVPRPVSRDRWAASGADVTLVDLPGCGHWPVVGSGAPGYAGWDHDRLAGDFTATVAHWLLARNGCATTSPARGWTGSTTPATSCKRTPRPSS